MNKKKEVTKEQKIKTANTREKKKDEYDIKKNDVVKIETQIIESQYKSGLKEYLEQRMYDLKYKVAHLDLESNLVEIEIDNIIRGKDAFGNTPLYSTESLSMLFEYYRSFIIDINKIKRYVPTKENFCSFANISTATYDNYMTQGEVRKREVMTMINDYIVDIQLRLAQTNDLSAIPTIFRMKTEHKMVEAVAPTIIEHKHEIDTSEMKRQIEALKSGKSLKTVELDKNSYSVEN